MNCGRYLCVVLFRKNHLQCAFNEQWSAISLNKIPTDGFTEAFFRNNNFAAEYCVCSFRMVIRLIVANSYNGARLWNSNVCILVNIPIYI